MSLTGYFYTKMYPSTAPSESLYFRINTGNNSHMLLIKHDALGHEGFVLLSAQSTGCQSNATDCLQELLYIELSIKAESPGAS